MARVRMVTAVVPGYFLVWYNSCDKISSILIAVVPGYFLVWYNRKKQNKQGNLAVVPGYFLVWYNLFWHKRVVYML